jgi:hypothetical protein
VRKAIERAEGSKPRVPELINHLLYEEMVRRERRLELEDHDRAMAEESGEEYVTSKQARHRMYSMVRRAEREMERNGVVEPDAWQEVLDAAPDDSFGTRAKAQRWLGISAAADGESLTYPR